MQRGNLSWPPTPAWRTADCSLTTVAFVSSCCHANTAWLLSAQPSNCWNVAKKPCESNISGNYHLRVVNDRLSRLKIYFTAPKLTLHDTVPLYVEITWGNGACVTLSGSYCMDCLNFPEEDKILVGGPIPLSSVLCLEVSTEVLQPSEDCRTLATAERCL